jgi:hypothetical protein
MLRGKGSIREWQEHAGELKTVSTVLISSTDEIAEIKSCSVRGGVLLN